MKDCYKQFGMIVGSILGGKELPDIEYDWEKLSSLFRKQNMLPIYYRALLKADEQLSNKPDKSVIDSVFYLSAKRIPRQINQQCEIERLKGLFEEYGIDNLFLKGSVIYKRYPDPMLRTMNDIDLLYKPSQHKLIKKVLMEHDYVSYSEGRKNDTYRKTKHILLEAHRQLVPSDSEFFDWCDKIWERSVLSEGMKNAYEMKLEDEIVFCIIHMAIHFLEGGIGARFLCDLYVYNNIGFDREYVVSELGKIGLADFFNKMSDLVDLWFDGKADSRSYDSIIDYIMGGGVFGKKENARALATEKGGSSYLKQYWFPSYREMCSLYPWLDGKPYLLPAAWGKRGFNAVFVKKKSLKRSIGISKNADSEKSEEIRKLYREYGLNMTLRK